MLHTKTLEVLERGILPVEQLLQAPVLESPFRGDIISIARMAKVLLKPHLELMAVKLP